MPIINRIAELANDVKEWRHDIHQNPELLYDVHRTAGVGADKLRDFGCDEVVTGIGRTGVVGVIKGRSDSKGRTIGLRADMDALPIVEATDVPYKSRSEGKKSRFWCANTRQPLVGTKAPTDIVASGSHANSAFPCGPS